MKTLMIATIALSLGLAVSAATANPDFLDGFDKCERNWPNLTKALSKKPVKREGEKGEYWGFDVYTFNSTYMGVPMKGLVKGNCGQASGWNDQCGFSGYLALTVNTSYQNAYKILKRRTGIDYRDELVDDEAGSNTRMQLVKADGDVYLACDTGGI